MKTSLYFIRWNKIVLFGHNSTKGDNPVLKTRISYFLMMNPSMKFKTPSLILVLTDGQAQSNMPLQLFQSLGHNNGKKDTCCFGKRHGF